MFGPPETANNPSVEGYSFYLNIVVTASNVAAAAANGGGSTTATPSKPGPGGDDDNHVAATNVEKLAISDDKGNDDDEDAFAEKKEEDLASPQPPVPAPVVVVAAAVEEAPVAATTALPTPDEPKVKDPWNAMAMIPKFTKKKQKDENAEDNNNNGEDGTGNNGGGKKKSDWVSSMSVSLTKSMTDSIRKSQDMAKLKSRGSVNKNPDEQPLEPTEIASTTPTKSKFQMTIPNMKLGDGTKTKKFMNEIGTGIKKSGTSISRNIQKSGTSISQNIQKSTTGITLNARQFVNQQTMVSRAEKSVTEIIPTLSHEIGVEMSIRKRFQQGPVFVLEVDLKGCDLSIILEKTLGNDKAQNYKQAIAALLELNMIKTLKELEQEILPKIRQGLMSKLSAVVPQKINSIHQDLCIECITLENHEEAKWLYNFLEYMESMK